VKERSRCDLVAPMLALSLLVSCSMEKERRGTTEPATGTAASLVSSKSTGWSEPVSLEINTAYTEQQPALSKNGLSLYFMSNRPEDLNDGDLEANIWVSHRACLECAWQAPVELPAPVNGPSNDAQPSLSRDEHWLFFVTGRVAKQGNDIWVSYRDNVHDDLGWQAPAPLGPTVNTTALDGGPSYFANDGGSPQLFFFSDRVPATKTDIYMSELKSDGTWGIATPVAELNSTVADQKASVTPNGLEIYFWSARDAKLGHAGESFIWHSMRPSVSERWSKPTLVEDPVNSQPATQPFIYIHGRSESLLIVRNTTTDPRKPANLDIFEAARTRGGDQNR